MEGIRRHGWSSEGQRCLLNAPGSAQATGAAGRGRCAPSNEGGCPVTAAVNRSAQSPCSSPRHETGNVLCGAGAHETSSRTGADVGGVNWRCRLGSSLIADRCAGRRTQPVKAATHEQRDHQAGGLRARSSPTTSGSSDWGPEPSPWACSPVRAGVLLVGRSARRAAGSEGADADGLAGQLRPPRREEDRAREHDRRVPRGRRAGACGAGVGRADVRRRRGRGHPRRDRGPHHGRQRRASPG